MKNGIRFLIFATALIGVALAYPDGRNGKPQQDAVEDDQGGPVLGIPVNIDPGFGGGFLDFGEPFYGWFSGLQSAMKRLRDQIAFSLPAYPTDSSSFGAFPSVPKGANTTSSVTVVDGHVVTVNETTYTDGDENHSAVFRIRVIEVQPENSESTESTEVESITDSSTEKPTSTSDRSVETLENFDENEIPQTGDVRAAAK